MKTVYIVSSDTMVENPIVGNYMHKMSQMIGEVGAELQIKADIIYPKTEDTFWCKVIGLGYPTPEAPGFRWCTERLKINPMNKYTLDTIKNNGEVVLLLGVRKAESVYRANNIRSREIEGKILIPHNDIENAYVYNPLTEIPNEIVWEFLLKDDGKTPLVECLVWNIPDGIITKYFTWDETVKESIIYLYNAIKNNEHKEWGEVSERLYLFVERKWTADDVKDFLRNMWNYLGYE